MVETSSARILVCLVFLGIALSAQTPSDHGNDGAIYVGVLDDSREEMVNWKPGVAKQRFIRPAFEKTATGWKQVDFSALPDHMDWTVAFDGKSIGEVESQGASKEGLTPVQNILTPVYAIPTVGSPSNQFAGLMRFGPTNVRRPLIVVSRPYFHDPDGWKRTKLSNEIAVLVRAAFRNEYPHIDRCKEERKVESDWNFSDSALSFPVAYASNKRSFLVQTSLTGDCGWVDQPDDPRSEPWFFVSENGTVRRIGSFMKLLDAGDYDSDGKSEVVFLLSQGEDTDGFVLFYSRFEKQVSLQWHYH